MNRARFGALSLLLLLLGALGLLACTPAGSDGPLSSEKPTATPVPEKKVSVPKKEPTATPAPEKKVSVPKKKPTATPAPEKKVSVPKKKKDVAARLPDLTVDLTVPSAATAGDVIGGAMTVLVNNIGSATAPGKLAPGDPHTGYGTDIYIATTTTPPPSQPMFAASYSEYVLLQGGRANNTTDVVAGGSINYSGQLSPSKIPADTPAGEYYICGWVDAGENVTEEDETNNFDCQLITVTSGDSTDDAVYAPTCPFNLLAGAQTFTVVDPADLPDADLTDNLCLSTAGTCTLRAAIQQANAIDAPFTLITLLKNDYQLTIPAGVPDSGCTTGTCMIAEENDAAVGDLDIHCAMCIQGQHRDYVTIRGGGEVGRVFDVHATAASQVFIRDLTVSDGYAPAFSGPDPLMTTMAMEGCESTADECSGGAIRNEQGPHDLYLQQVVLSGNASNGNGNAVSNAGDMVISGSIVEENRDELGHGGGVYNTGTLTVQYSTFDGNRTDSSGGGIVTMGGVVDIVNSTFHANESAWGGSALSISAGGDINVLFSTIANSVSPNSGAPSVGGAAVYAGDDGQMRFKNSIVADTAGFNCAQSSGAIIVSGDNLSTDLTCPGFNTWGPGNLGPLAVYGGGPSYPTYALQMRTLTMEPNPSSPAVDGAQDCTYTFNIGPSGSPVMLDQRAEFRSTGPCDLGAHESASMSLVPDPSFGIGGKTGAFGWEPNPNGVSDAVFAWNTSFGRTDNYSVRITTRDGNPDVPLANPGWITTDFIPVVPKHNYEVSVFTFTPDGGVGHVPAVQFFDKDGIFLGTQGATGPSGISDPIGVWVEKVFTFTPSPGRVKIRLILVQDTDQTKGKLTTVNFDDVNLVDLSAHELTFMPMVPGPSIGLSGESGLSQFGDWEPNPNGVSDAVFTWDPTFGQTDNSSLSISTSEGNPEFPLDNPGWITANFIPVEPNHQYEVSVFTFTPDGGVGHIPAVQFFNGAGEFMHTRGATGPSGISDPIGVWIEKKFGFTTGPDEMKVKLILVQDLHQTKGKLTTVYFDDVHFGEPPGCVPSLLSPAAGALMDNGRRDRADDIVWDFDWSDCPGATRYHLYVKGENATKPVINRSWITNSSSFGNERHYDGGGSYITGTHLHNWTWKVRAMVSGEWGGWSEVRSFDVEPVDTDPNLQVTSMPMMPDPSFMAGFMAGSKAGLNKFDAWGPNPNGVSDAVFTWDPTFGRTGDSSLSITTSEGNPDVPLAKPGWITTDFIPVGPDQQYAVSVFTYTRGGGGGRIAVQFFNWAGEFMHTRGATGPSDISDPVNVWVEKKFAFTTGPDEMMVKLILVQDLDQTPERKGKASRVYFDDVRFVYLASGDTTSGG